MVNDLGELVRGTSQTETRQRHRPTEEYRKHLSEDGLVIIVATVDSKTGKVLAGPDLVSRGFVYVRENESLMDGAQSIVENALDRCVEEHVRDWNSVKTRVREALSSYIYRRTKRSPMILPIIMEV